MDLNNKFREIERKVVSEVLSLFDRNNGYILIEMGEKRKPFILGKSRGFLLLFLFFVVCLFVIF